MISFSKAVKIFAAAFIVISALIFLAPRYFPIMTNTIIPWATLALAFVAVLTILYASEQEKRHKKEARISEIIEWATVGQRLFSRYLPITTPGERSDTIRLLGELTARKIGMLTGARMFGDEFLSQFKEAAEGLDLFNNWLKEPAGEEVNNQLERVNIHDLTTQCEKSFSKLLESAVKLRSELNL